MSNNYYHSLLGLEGRAFILSQEIINRLHEIPRTGWLDRGIKNPETVGEHTDQVVLIAQKYFAIRGLAKMLVIHDWAESNKNVGDLRTDIYCPPERRFSKEEKYKLELAAMKKICSKLSEEGESILNLWLEFEEQKTRRAKIAYQIDKFQAIKQAFEYERKGYNVSAQEFISHDGSKIKNIILRHALEKIKVKLR